MKRITWKTCLRTCVVAIGMSVLATSGPTLFVSPAALVAAEDSAKEAATVEEAAKVLDLRTLPLPEGAVVPLGRHLGSLNYETQADMKKAFQFQQQQLTQLGWKELPGARIQAEYCTANFQKSGFIVSVSSYGNSDPAKQGSAQVYLSNLGNVRLSKLPAVKGAKQLAVTEAATIYTTTLTLAEAVAATRTLLVDAGWESYGATSNPPDSEILTFKRNAIRLTAFVSVPPAQKNQVMINYSTSLMSVDLPALPNANEVKFDETQKTLMFQTSDSFDDVAKSYKQRLAKSGWTPRTKELSKSKYGDDRPLGELAFENGAKDSLFLQLTEKGGKTQVRLNLKTAAEIAAVKAAQEKFAAEDKAKKEAEAAVAEAKPTPKSATAKKPTAKSDDGFPDVDALIKGAVGDALKNAGLDGKKLATDAAKGNSADELRVKGLPIPEGATDISSMKERGDVRFNVTSDFKTIGSFYAKQLGEQRWTKSEKDNLQRDFWVQTFAKDKMSLEVRVAKREGGCEVRLTPTGGLLWDADDQPSQRDLLMLKLKLELGKRGKDAAADGPTRPEKAKKGIDKLPKLTSDAKVIVNGETITLPHVLAYEAVSAGQWVTRIVATDKPLNQESLTELLKLRRENRSFNLRSPFLLLVLDDKDRPDFISVDVQKFQIDLGDRNYKGDAIVEDGRARGSIQTKDPVEFNGRTITAEITFDVPLLTSDSKPAKQLSDAPKPETSEPDKPKKGVAKLPKLENSGKLLVNDKPVKLGNVVAYELMVSGKKMTVINFTDKPINLPKLKTLLAKDGSDLGLFDFDSQAKLEIDTEDKISVILVAHENASFPILGGSNVLSDVIIEDGRARGTVKLEEPKKFSGKSYSLDLTFDVEVLKLPAKE